MPTLRQRVHGRGILALAQRHIRPALLSLALTAGMTACMLGAAHVVETHIVELNHVSIVYLIPVLISATRWGILPGIVSALAGVAASAFFFYPPIYSLQVSNPQQVIDLILFLLVAVVTSHLAASVRRHFATAQQREDELRALYSFSRRLAVASAPPDIYTAIQDHLNMVLGRRVALFEAMPDARQPDAQQGRDHVPDVVRAAIADAMQAGGSIDELPIVDQRTQATWLIRAVSRKTPAFGVVAIDIGRVSDETLDGICHRVDAVLADAAATLERLDVARAIGEARMRTEAETFRDALIESVSHELRSPLASILGSSSVLAKAPGIAREPRLAALAEVLHEEAERLDNDIQNLLDASRITSAGLRPHLQWADVADIVNSAVERQQRRLCTHRLSVAVPDDLPLVRADPVLIEQALGQILDNAAKYSPAGSSIDVAASDRDGEVSIAASDQGGGLSDEERDRLWDRFYRSPRHHATTAGSGLGLWIARAFVLACGGRMEATSPGVGRGTTVTIHLPAPRPAAGDEVGSDDE